MLPTWVLLDDDITHSTFAYIERLTGLCILLILGFKQMHNEVSPEDKLRRKILV